MPLATPIPNDCADRDNKSGGLLSVAGGPGENGDGASGNRAGTKKRNFVDVVDGLQRKFVDFVDGLLHQPSPKRHSHFGSGSGHCHYPSSFHPGWWNGGFGNYASPHPHRCQNDAAPLLPQQWQLVLINDRWVQIDGHPWVLMTVQVWKNVSTPINQPQLMLLNNQWVWMCVHVSASEQKEQQEAKKKAKLEEQQRLKLLEEAKKKAKLEEQQRLKLLEEAKRKAKLEKQQRELLQKLDDETDQKKRRNLKVGLDYSSRLLMEIIDESKDEQTKKQLENWLGKEFRELLQIPTGPTHFQNKYLNNLEGRKKSRGHSESEEYQKKFQRMKDAKKAFDKTVKAVQHKQIEEEFPELKELIKAIADGRSDDLHGNAGEFSEEDAAAMAGEKVKEMLTLLAKDAKISVMIFFHPA